MKKLFTALLLTYAFSGLCQDHQPDTFAKSTFAGVSLGSVSFKDGILSPLRYNMPMFGLRFEHQKTKATNINRLTMSLDYANRPAEGKLYKQCLQANISFAKLVAMSQNVYVGGQSTLNLHTRFGDSFAQTSTNALGSNLVLNLSPALQYRKTLVRTTGNWVFSDTFSGAVLGIAASGSGNDQGYAGPIFTFSALNKFYNISNHICVDFQNQSKKSAWRLAYHWEFSTFRSPIGSQYGSSLISISKQL